MIQEATLEVYLGTSRRRGTLTLRREEMERQLEIVHCVVRNPFQPTSLEAFWLSSTVVALATGIYAERAYDRLPILAGALQEAGCDDPAVLDYCRTCPVQVELRDRVADDRPTIDQFPDGTGGPSRPASAE